MANEEAGSEASVVEDGIVNPDSSADSKNSNFPAKDFDLKDEGLCTTTLNEVYKSNDGTELFKSIPQLKDIFHIKSKIGEGTFSKVYLAHLIEDPDELFALKYIIPTSAPDRVEREVRCLQLMGGKNNVIGYKGTIRNQDHSAVILPYFPHDKFQDYLYDLSVPDIQDYMKNLMTALNHIHCFSVIHRDVKPGNFLHSRTTKRYNLVDFGLAMHEPGSKKAWDIEKKKGANAKKGNGKNVRLLSPESCETNQVAKKPRTSPRASVMSHKLTKQSGPASKAVPKNSLVKHGQCSYNAGVKPSVVLKNHNQNVKLMSKQAIVQQKSSCEKPSSSLKSSSGLCETQHKKFDICSLCMKRSMQNAPRAGTSGFRAPEVLMKHPQQTTGVIMLCLLSGRYPFFRCFDDMTALAQIISLFGKKQVMDSSKYIGKYVESNTCSAGHDLKEVCQKLRLSSRREKDSLNQCCRNCKEMKIMKKEDKSGETSGKNSRTTQSRTTSLSGNISNSIEKSKVRFLSTGHLPQTEQLEQESSRPSKKDSTREHLDGGCCTCHCSSCPQYVPSSAYDLLQRCLDLNPLTRITAGEALRHPFLSNDDSLGILRQPEG